MNNQFEQAQTRRRSYAADFRAQARNMLQNRWGIAILVGFLVVIFGSVGSVFSIDRVDSEDLIPLIRQLQESGNFQKFVTDFLNLFLVPRVPTGFMTALAAFGTCTTLAVRFFVGGPVAVGYSRFNLDLIDSGKEPKVGTLFGAFGTCFWKSVGVRVLVSLIQGAILFISLIPTWIFLTTGMLKTENMFSAAMMILAIGVPVMLIGSVLNLIVSYQYCFAPYILAEYPTVGVMDALRNSRNLMKGNKWRLFCLYFSFIGWFLLACCTCGLGMLAVIPYMNAATAAFYNEIARRDEAKQAEFPSIDPNDYFPQ